MHVRLDSHCMYPWDGLIKSGSVHQERCGGEVSLKFKAIKGSEMFYILQQWSYNTSQSCIYKRSTLFFVFECGSCGPYDVHNGASTPIYIYQACTHQVSFIPQVYHVYTYRLLDQLHPTSAWCSYICTAHQISFIPRVYNVYMTSAIQIKEGILWIFITNAHAHHGRMG